MLLFFEQNDDDDWILAAIHLKYKICFRYKCLPEIKF